MALETFEISFDGDAADKTDGWVYNLGIHGSITLYRIRVKKSSAGGTGVFNIDAGSSLGKNMVPEDLIIDIDPEEIIDEYSDGDDIVDIPNPVAGGVCTSPTGEEPLLEYAGTNITTYAAMDFGATTDCRTLLDPALTFDSGEPFSIAIVLDVADTTEAPVIGSDVGAGSNASWYGNNGSKKITIQDESGNSVTSSGRDHLYSSDIRVLTRDTSDVIYEYKRGVQSMTGSLGGTFKPQILCNAQQGSTWYTAPFNITRVLISEGAWTTAERQDIEGWLAWEYGLQTAVNSYLPVSHPYYQGTSPITPYTKSYGTSIDLSGLGADTYTGWQSPDDSTITGPIKVFVEKVYKIGTITAEIIVSY